MEVEAYWVIGRIVARALDLVGLQYVPLAAEWSVRFAMDMMEVEDLKGGQKQKIL